MKNLITFFLLVCIVLVYLSKPCDARRRKKQSRGIEVGRQQSRSGHKARASGLTKLERQERRQPHMNGKQNGIGINLNRRMKVKEKSSQRNNYRSKYRRKHQRKNRRKHPFRAHRMKNIKSESTFVTTTIEPFTEAVPSVNETEFNISTNENITKNIFPEIDSQDSAVTPESTTAASISQTPSFIRKTIVGGNKSPCVTTSDCLPGHCCITKKNKGSRCKRFEAPAGKKCWDTCMCANGMECFVKNKRDFSKHRRIRKKGKKQKGLCKVPETDDVIKGIYLKV